RAPALEQHHAGGRLPVRRRGGDHHGVGQLDPGGDRLVEPAAEEGQGIDAGVALEERAPGAVAAEGRQRGGPAGVWRLLLGLAHARTLPHGAAAGRGAVTDRPVEKFDIAGSFRVPFLLQREGRSSMYAAIPHRSHPPWSPASAASSPSPAPSESPSPSPSPRSPAPDQAPSIRTSISPRARPTSPARRRTGARRPGTRRRRCTSDRKSTRLNSSHVKISYAVFCLKKKKNQIQKLKSRTKG